MSLLNDSLCECECASLLANSDDVTAFTLSSHFRSFFSTELASLKHARLLFTRLTRELLKELLFHEYYKGASVPQILHREETTNASK